MASAHRSLKHRDHGEPRRSHRAIALFKTWATRSSAAVQLRETAVMRNGDSDARTGQPLASFWTCRGQSPCRSTSSALRGVPGTALCLRCPAGCPPRSAQCRCRATPAGHHPGAAVHVTRQAAGVPSARSQPFPATPARPSRWDDAGTPPIRRRIRGPALRDTAPRAFRKGPAPPLPHRLRFHGQTGRPHHVTLSERVPPSESKGPPKNRSGPSRAAPFRTGGDLSTRSRTHSLKVTWVFDLALLGARNQAQRH